MEFGNKVTLVQHLCPRAEGKRTAIELIEAVAEHKIKLLVSKVADSS